MGGQGRTVEEVCARIAHDQHGVVSRAQLVRAGITPRQIDRRLLTGGLIRVHRSVYRVGHRAASVEARYMAAVLACGDDALLSGPSAAHLLGLIRRGPAEVEVIAPTERRVDGIRTHRERINARDRIRWRGIPVTSAARTLVDLAAGLPADQLARACHEAGIKHGTTPAAVERVLARRGRSSGATKLREILRGDVRVTLSKLERRFLERLAEAGLALPETNRPAGGGRVDCRWRAERLTVELDGYRYHHSRHAWEQDRRREREARARGDEFRRYSYGDVFDTPQLMLAELQRLLPARPRRSLRNGGARAQRWCAASRLSEGS
jgi:very-short-patch-repair endonuclease